MLIPFLLLLSFLFDTAMTTEMAMAAVVVAVVVVVVYSQCEVALRTAT